MAVVFVVGVTSRANNGGNVGVKLVSRFLPTSQVIFADVIFGSYLVGVHGGVGFGECMANNRILFPML